MEYQKNRIDILCRYKKDKILSKKSEVDNQIQSSFIFDSSDRYIKNILISNKWKYLGCQSKNYVLKWIYMPKHNTFSQLLPNQRINHFPHTHILSTKLGLKRTLTSQRSAYLGWKGRSQSSFFPRSYDLSQQNSQFERDFKRTAICNLLKKLMIVIELQASQIFNHLSRQILCNTIDDKNWLREVRQLLDYDLMWQKNSELLKSCRLRLNSNIFESMLCYLSIIFTVDTNLRQQDFVQKQLKILIKYSLYNPPYNDLNQHFEGNRNLAKLPTLSAIKLFFYLYKQCYQSWSWFKADGLQNIWVVKTSDSSRGRSIFLIQSIQQAQCLNNGMRVIQKYIENVWIYRPQLKYKQIDKIKKLQNRKFDIRLWILVKSFSPLQAYIYQQGYLRISKTNYQLHDISNQKSHLTNFSINWNKSQDIQDSYILLSQFLYFIDCNQIKSSAKLKRQIRQIITHTLYSAQILTNNGDHRCFQLFGFDIILDGDLNPWLLECNMSPACKERGNLTNILQEMGSGLLSLVGIIDKNPNEKKWERITPIQYSTTGDKYKYINKYSKQNITKESYKSENSIKLLKKCSSSLFGQSQINGQQSRVNIILPAIVSNSFHSDQRPLMIVGRKVTKSYLNKLDRYHVVLSATLKIQYFIKKHFLLKSDIKSQVSLRCLKLIEKLAKINRTRMIKMFKKLRRFSKKLKKLDSRA